MARRYVDISAYQGAVDWPVYRTWSDLVAMKATEGTGFIDPRYRTNRAGAEDQGIESFFYHFARPDLNRPQAEAAWFFNVVGGVKTSELLMLDAERSTPQPEASWSYAWLSEVEQLYQKTPTIYASEAFIRAHLQGEPRLARFPLILAKWTFDPNARPPAPAPWTTYLAIQWTDRASNIPGITGLVDADVFVGERTMGIPQGWSDANGILTAPNGVPVHDGFRHAVENDPHFDPANLPNEAEYNANPVQFHRPDLGNGDRQTFRDTVFWWTPAMGVIVEKFPGLELDAAYKLIAQQQAEVDALKANPPTPMPNIVDAVAQLEAAQSAATAIGTSLGKALSDLKQ